VYHINFKKANKKNTHKNFISDKQKIKRSIDFSQKLVHRKSCVFFSFFTEGIVVGVILERGGVDQLSHLHHRHIESELDLVVFFLVFVWKIKTQATYTCVVEFQKGPSHIFLK